MMAFKFLPKFGGTSGQSGIGVVTSGTVTVVVLVLVLVVLVTFDGVIFIVVFAYSVTVVLTLLLICVGDPSVVDLLLTFKLLFTIVLLTLLASSIKLLPSLS